MALDSCIIDIPDDPDPNFTGSLTGNGSFSDPTHWHAESTSGSVAGDTINGAVHVVVDGVGNATAGTYTGTIDGAIVGTLSGSYSGGSGSTTYVITTPSGLTMSGSFTFTPTGGPNFNFTGTLTGTYPDPWVGGEWDFEIDGDPFSVTADVSSSGALDTTAADIQTEIDNAGFNAAVTAHWNGGVGRTIEIEFDSPLPTTFEAITLPLTSVSTLLTDEAEMSCSTAPDSPTGTGSGSGSGSSTEDTGTDTATDTATDTGTDTATDTASEPTGTATGSIVCRDITFHIECANRTSFETGPGAGTGSGSVCECECLPEDVCITFAVTRLNPENSCVVQSETITGEGEWSVTLECTPILGPPYVVDIRVAIEYNEETGTCGLYLYSTALNVDREYYQNGQSVSCALGLSHGWSGNIGTTGTATSSGTAPAAFEIWGVSIRSLRCGEECGVDSECCPGETIPRAVTLSITGSCECGNGDYTLSYTTTSDVVPGSNVGWQYVGPLGGCSLPSEITFFLYCPELTGTGECGDWLLRISSFCVAGVKTVEACGCNPLVLDFGSVDTTGIGCCDLPVGPPPVNGTLNFLVTA